jgi:hypothetical protein
MGLKNIFHQRDESVGIKIGIRHGVRGIRRAAELVEAPLVERMIENG